MFNFIKKTIISNRVEETILYECVLDELEDGFKVRGLWGKALAMSEGDENKATSLYMQYRVQNIKDYFTVLKIAYEELSKSQIKNKLVDLNKKNDAKVNFIDSKDNNINQINKASTSVETNENIVANEFERIKCPHCNTFVYLKDNNCWNCGKDIRKIDQTIIDKFNEYNGKKFIIKNKIDNEMLVYCGNNLKIVRKALDLNKNENCGLNDYLIDKNGFEYLLLKHGSHYILISNYGIKTQFNF